MAPFDFSWVRGANYIPSNAAWDFFAPDVWDEALVDRELGFAADLRLNSLRIRTSPHAFNTSAGTFRANMHTFLGMARARNLSVMPTLFDTGDLTTFDAAVYGSYLRAVTGDGAGRTPPWDAVVGYDVCNECFFTSKGSAAEAALAVHIAALGKLAAPLGRFVTTGMGNMGNWPRELDQLRMPGLSLVSFHSYNGNQSDFDAGIERLAHASTSAQLQLGFASEVGNRPWDPLCGDLDVLRRRGLGFFFWELMQSQSGWAPPRCAGCPSYQGLLFPNGSAFSEEEVACIKQAAGPASERTVDWVPVKWGVDAARVQPPRFAPDDAWSIVSAGSSALPWQDRPIRGQLAAQWQATAPINVAGEYDEVNPGTGKVDTTGIVVTQSQNVVSASCNCTWQSGDGGVLTGCMIQNMRFTKRSIVQNGTVAANRSITWTNGAVWRPSAKEQRVAPLPTVTLVFVGARVTLWFAALPGGATLDVQVDGKSTGQHVRTEASELEVSASVDVASGLDSADEHTLVLTVVGGSALSISGFDVWKQ
jgi:hypothetical protein